MNFIFVTALTYLPYLGEFSIVEEGPQVPKVLYVAKVIKFTCKRFLVILLRYFLRVHPAVSCVATS